MYHYIGASFGSILTGYISHKLRSRKKALLIAISFVGLLCIIYFNAFGISSSMFFFILFVLGIAQGYWAVIIAVASEQFGTNIRSTATTTVPNFIRGATVLMTLWWSSMSAGMGILRSAMIVGATVIILALIAVFFLEESHGKDLDYIEVE